MTRKEAIDQAVVLLKDEANELAYLLSDPRNQLGHRAKVAVQRELQRFRDIAETLKPTKVDE